MACMGVFDWVFMDSVACRHEDRRTFIYFKSSTASVVGRPNQRLREPPVLSPFTFGFC